MCNYTSRILLLIVAIDIILTYYNEKYYIVYNLIQQKTPISFEV